MELYYSPGSCALAVHIVANEAQVPLDLVKVDLSSKKTEQGQDYLAINPNGYVPALMLDDGEILTEVPVLLQYLANMRPDSGLMPVSGSMSFYRTQQWLAFIATELHKNFSPLFRPDSGEQARTASRTLLTRRFNHVNAQIKEKPFLSGETFTVADAYLWTVLGWTQHVKFDLSGYSSLLRFREAVSNRPSVRNSLKEEELA